MNRAGVSVIVVTFNSASTIRLCLSRLMDALGAVVGDNWEIIVVDNCSTDDTVSEVRTTCDQRVRLVENSHNVGFGVANNLGVAVAKNDILWLVNPDVYVNGLALVKLLDALRKYEFSGPALVDLGGNRSASPSPRPNWLFVLALAFRYLYGRKAIHRLRRIVSGLGLARISRTVETHLAGQEACTVGIREYISCACFIVRRKAFCEVSGFDERFFLYSEDADLVLRLQRAGFRGSYIAEATVLHEVGSSGGRAYMESPQLLSGMLTFLCIHRRRSYSVGLPALRAAIQIHRMFPPGTPIGARARLLLPEIRS